MNKILKPMLGNENRILETRRVPSRVGPQQAFGVVDRLHTKIAFLRHIHCRAKVAFLHDIAAGKA